jgi:hypothetical protein
MLSFARAFQIGTNDAASCFAQKSSKIVLEQKGASKKARAIPS